MKDSQHPHTAGGQEEATADSSTSPVARWLRRGLLVLSLGLLTRMGMANLPEIRHAAGELLTRSWWIVVPVLLFEVVWTVSLANVYRSSLLAFGGRLGRRDAIRVSMGAFSLSRILPGGGAAGSVFAAKEIISLGNPVPRTIVSMLVSWWVSMLTLAAVVGLGTAIGIPEGLVDPAHVIGPAVVGGVLVLLGAVVFVALRYDRSRTRIVSGIAKAGSRLRVEAKTGDWDEVATSSVAIGRFLPLLGWATLSWVADAAALWMMFLGFGVRLHPAVLLVGYGLANLINALPELTPGWLGVIESALAAAYAALGVPIGVAVVAVLCYRLVSYWMPVAAGAGPALSLLRGHRIPAAGPGSGVDLQVAA